MSLDTGFHFGVPEAQYHADPCERPSLSASIAHILLSRSPAHAQFAHPRLNPALDHDEPTSEMDFGRAAHRLLLEGHDDGIVIVEANDWRTKAAQQAREEARAGDLIPLLTHKYEELLNMVAAGGEQLSATEIGHIIGHGQAEVTMIWQHPSSPAMKLCWQRARIDYLWDKADVERPIVLDYKTTTVSADPLVFVRQMLSLGADLQAAQYVRGVEALTGRTPAFVFVVQETAPPYLLSLISLAPAWLAFALHKMQRATAIWERCLATDDWPAYPTKICYAELPAWAENQFSERELRDA